MSNTKNSPVLINLAKRIARDRDRIQRHVTETTEQIKELEAVARQYPDADLSKEIENLIRKRGRQSAALRHKEDALKFLPGQ